MNVKEIVDYLLGGFVVYQIKPEWNHVDRFRFRSRNGVDFDEIQK